MKRSRGENATLNIIVGWSAQVGILVLSFVSRKIFVHFLSTDYLGINGLYSNILSLLSLAELGLGNVTQFFLYKPVVENNTRKISALMSFFRNMYIGIAATVLVLGLMLIPFLRYIINSELQQEELLLYYVLFLVNSCVTYLSADRTALLAANQDNRVTKYVTLSVNVILQVMHIIVLSIWKNYTIYVLATLLSTVMNVIVTNAICDRRYPLIKEKHLSEELIDRRYILDNVKSTFVYKIGATIINNTDNILISIMVSTAAVGIYSNYYMVVSGIQMFISIITVSLISGIGNLSAHGDRRRMKEIFFLLLMVYQFIATWGGISFGLLINQFIPMWLGADYLIDDRTVFAIALSFYLTNAISPIWMFREANGLFKKVKYLLVSTAVANIALSVWLGGIWGMFGILLATSIARLVTQVWYEPQVLFKNLFNETSKNYWKKQIKYLALALVCMSICCVIPFDPPYSIFALAGKAFVYLIVCLIIYFVFCHRTDEFKELRNRGVNVIKTLNITRRK